MSAPTEKVQKVLAQAGLGSRRAMEQAIREGRVSINGEVACIGDRVGAEDEVALDGVALRRKGRSRTRVLIYNKPEGEVCSRSDPEGRPTVFERLPRLLGERWVSVGRLDVATSGLLLFTNNGGLAHCLMHPSTGIDREYLVRVNGNVDEDMLKRLSDGVLLEDGLARFTDLQESKESDEDRRNRWFYVCLMEGRNREVRRLWESQGVQVSRLKRVRYGPVFIPSHVRAGQWQEMPADDLRKLCRQVGFELGNQKSTPAEKLREQRQERRLRKSTGPRRNRRR